MLHVFIDLILIWKLCCGTTDVISCFWTLFLLNLKKNKKQTWLTCIKISTLNNPSRQSIDMTVMYLVIEWNILLMVHLCVHHYINQSSCLFTFHHNVFIYISSQCIFALSMIYNVCVYVYMISKRTLTLDRCDDFPSWAYKHTSCTCW